MGAAPATVSTQASPREQAYLDAMASIEAIAAALATRAHVWGGMALDIHQGRFLRAHGDIDCFVVDLRDRFDAFGARLSGAGWEVRDVLDRHLLWARRGAVKLHLGHITVAGQTVEWKHNGRDGSIWFPLAWLAPDAVPFLGIHVHVAAPELGYVLKTHPQLMNPEWALRDKDRADIEVLRAMLLTRHSDLDALPRQVRSVP